jgi:hypothetical protein
MKITDALRSFVYLRRIAIALEAIAAQSSEQNRLMRKHWNIQDHPAQPHLTEIGELDIEAINKDWHRTRKELMIEDENGEET